MVGGNKAALMREFLKCMLRIFIAEHILYEFSIFITFFLDGLILPPISNSTAMRLARCPSNMDPIVFVLTSSFYLLNMIITLSVILCYKPKIEML